MKLTNARCFFAGGTRSRDLRSGTALSYAVTLYKGSHTPSLEFYRLYGECPLHISFITSTDLSSPDTMRTRRLLTVTSLLPGVLAGRSIGRRYSLVTKREGSSGFGSLPTYMENQICVGGGTGDSNVGSVSFSSFPEATTSSCQALLDQLTSEMLANNSDGEESPVLLSDAVAENFKFRPSDSAAGHVTAFGTQRNASASDGSVCSLEIMANFNQSPHTAGALAPEIRYRDPSLKRNVTERLMVSAASFTPRPWSSSPRLSSAPLSSAELRSGRRSR